MLEVVVGAVAAALVLAGLAVIAGPALPRLWRGAWLLARRRRPGVPSAAPTGGTALASGLHPTTARALTAAARSYGLLRANGEDRLASELRAAARLVRTNEPRGLLALASVLRPMRDVTIVEADARVRYQKLVGELRDAVKDRSEQLELLHFR